MKKYIVFFLFISSLLTAKVLIITHNFNRPDLIEMQHKTFQYFLKDPYEFVVFDDAIDENISKEMKNMCDKYGIKWVRVPQHLHTRKDPCNVRHAEGINYSLQLLGFSHDGVVFIIDSDMFLVRPFSIIEYMKNKDIASFISRSGDQLLPYLCPCLVFLAMDRLPDKQLLDFSVGMVKGVATDTGGFTHYYLDQHKDIRVTEVSRTGSNELFCGHHQWGYAENVTVPQAEQVIHLRQLGLNEQEITFLQKKPDTFEYYLGFNFLHYRAGSNYDGRSAEYHQRKARLFNEYLNTVAGN